MRVVIIEDKDGQALLDQLKLENLRHNNILRPLPDKTSIDDIHRGFHMVVVRWLQAQGWNR